MYELPPEFNLGLLRDCSKLNIYMNMCPYVANRGLGQPLSTAVNWFATHQFMAEMIFHARLENHPCRTFNPATADLFYVPFYGGLYASSVFREPNLTVRDELAVRLVDFLVKQPTWQKNYGKDHFLALGRTAWDFMRSQSGDFGANCLLNLPPVKNMSVLTVERQPWNGKNQFGIPYSSYFHPSTVDEMTTWQHKMKTSERPYLFSFIGGPRKGLKKAAVRDELIRQCNESTRCHLMKCGVTGSKCHHPMEVVKVMSMSEFCLQAPGDSFTRRSTFDSVLAGCIPVFFSPHTAYTQYMWYFPEDRSEYSVYIDDKGVNERKKIVEKELMKISRDKVVKMRSKIIELIPRITYAHPNAYVGFEDAVDVALKALANHVKSSLLPISHYAKNAFR
ncbi:Exostosin family protein [Euphorbia peplus]|nr:Exostosin family protein [Euphorbia peplus]